MVSYAQRPADEDHQYGHTCAEYFSAAFEGGLIIFIAALIILLTAGERLLNPQLIPEHWGSAPCCRSARA